MLTKEDIDAFKDDLENTNKTYDTRFDIKTVKVVEHENGDATYTFDMNEEMSQIVGELGLKLLLFCGAVDIPVHDVFDWIMTQKKEEENA